MLDTGIGRSALNRRTDLALALGGPAALGALLGVNPLSQWVRASPPAARPLLAAPPEGSNGRR